MLKLLFVSHSFPPPDEPTSNLGGMQRVAIDLHSALMDLDDVEVKSQVLQTSWAATHRRVPAFLLQTANVLRKEIKVGSVDAVLFSSMVTATLSNVTARSARRSGIPQCAIVHGLDVTTPFKPYQGIVRKTFGSLDAVFPVSSATAAACTERGLGVNKISVVHNGISDDRFDGPADANSRSLLKELLGIDKSVDTTILCSVGRQVKRKGFDWFIQNVLSHLPANTQYVLAGEGPMEDDIRAAAQSLHLGDRVHLLGRVSEEDLHLLYQSSDIFVMPNIRVPGDMEGFGVVMLEAGLAGLPVVAANIEGIKDVVDNGQNGFLVESENASAFLDILNKLIADTSLRESIVTRTRSSVLERFSWQRIAENYRNAIIERIDRSKR